MNAANEYNPFIINGYYDKLHFCDREDESNRLVTNLKNQTNTTLFSPRKLGKTGLINHIFALCNEDIECDCLYIDLYATQNLADFTQLLAKEIFATLPKKKSIAQRFMAQFSSLRPTLSFDPLTGIPELSLDLAEINKPNENIQSMFQYLDNIGHPVFIAFDEFQQIVQYPEKNTEALLRTILQKLRNCVFIFAGSHAGMMSEIFNSAKRPFYSSTAALALGKIPTEKYSVFIEKLFANRGRTIQPDAVAFILDWTNGYTYPVQYVCHQIFASGKRLIDLQFTRAIAAKVLEEQSHIYMQYRNMLTLAQWELAKAIAKESSISQPYQQAFIQQHKLGSVSTVKRGLDALIDKELVLAEATENGLVYSVYDKLFLRFLQRI